MVLGEKQRQEIWTGSVVDCDVHAVVPQISALFPYMDDVWVSWTTEREYPGPGHVATIYPPALTTTAREEWRPDDGRPPASELRLLRDHVLDPWDVDRAVVNCYYGIDNIRHPDLAAALARGVNNWLIAEWLEADPRLVGSMVVPARDPAAMIREIERVGSHPSIRQVLFPVRNDRLWGDRIYHSVYEAMVKHDLVMGLHWGGTTDGPPSPTGYASWFAEEYAAEWGNFGAHITSIVSEGVFRLYPDLRVSVLEGGFTWVPVWGWRFNKEWKALHREAPWMDRAPFDVIRERMRFSVAPADQGPPEAMERVLEWLGTEDILMFATDYPHGHNTDIGALLDVMPESMRPKVMSETAREWYRL